MTKNNNASQDDEDNSKQVQSAKRKEFLNKLEEKKRSSFQNYKNLKGNYPGAKGGSQIRPNPGATNKTQHKG